MRDTARHIAFEPGLQRESELTWWPEIGIGHCNVADLPSPYDRRYFDKYLRYEGTELSDKLLAFRLGLVRKHVGGVTLIDIGIGCGSFIKYRQAADAALTFGHDLNPWAAGWLLNNRSLAEPCDRGIEVATFWDSLEHIDDPRPVILSKKWCFVSAPIFTDAGHVLRSKHFRRNEHRWYFTHEGIIQWFAALGFALVEHTDEESKLGREDIGTYVFRRQ